MFVSVMNYELSNYYFSVSFVVSRDYPIDYVTQFFTNGNILSDNLNAIRLLHCSQAGPPEGISTSSNSLEIDVREITVTVLFRQSYSRG